MERQEAEAAGQEGMPQDRGGWGDILLKKTAQGGAFAKAGRAWMTVSGYCRR